MRLRPMTRDDLVVASHINTIAFEGDEIFNWVMPNAAQYPDVWRQRQTIRTKQRFHTLGVVSLVVETEPQDAGWSGRPEIAGFAFWIRRGADATARKWREERDSFWNSTFRVDESVCTLHR
jgi:hypothetical protein